VAGTAPGTRKPDSKLPLGRLPGGLAGLLAEWVICDPGLCCWRPMP